MPSLLMSSRTQSPTPLHDAHWSASLERHDLSSILTPRTIAVIGASESVGSVGHTVMKNLLTGGFAGKVIPINPKHTQVMGQPSFPYVAAANLPFDLAVITTPATA